MLTLDRHNTILIDGEEHFWLDTADGIHRLRSNSGTIIELSASELSARTGTSRTALPIPLERYEDISDKQSATALRWAHHLEELTTGVNPLTGECRPEYDSETTILNDRVAAKLDELAREGMPASRATVMRKLSAYRDKGFSGLIDGRALRDRNTLGMIHRDALDALTTAIAKETYRSTGTASRVITEAKGDLIRRFGLERAEEIFPAQSTAYAYLNHLTGGRYTTGSARTRRSAANRPQRLMKAQRRLLPGSELQIDSTTMDVLVRTPNGTKPTRPILTIMVDIATRSIVAYTLRLTATKGVDHASLLAQALTPHQSRPDKAEFREHVAQMNPHATFLDATQRETALKALPFILPRRIMTDNGKDYRSRVFLSAAERFGISITHSSPHTPTDKAIVERTFGSINTLFTQHLPGYVGRSPEHRGLHVEKDNLLDIYGLFEMFDDWVVNEWQNRPHSSLRDPKTPTVRLSPNQFAHHAAGFTADIAVPLTQEDFISLLPVVYCTITTTGVRVNGQSYDCAELQPLRGRKSSSKKHSGKWAVKYDPYNPMTVWLGTTDGAFIECPLRDGILLHHPDLTADTGTEDLRHDVAFTMNTLQGTPLHRMPTTVTEHRLAENTPVDFDSIADLEEDSTW